MANRAAALAVTLVTLTLASVAQGQLPERVEAVAGLTATPADPRKVGEEAAFFAVYDDGEADVLVAPSADTYEVAMLFGGLGGGDVSLDGVDFCWRRGGTPTKIRYEVVVWAADGPGGSPGTELANFAAVATGVTTLPVFYSTDIGYKLTTSGVYIGVRWNPVAYPDFYFCVDTDGVGPTPFQPGYRRIDESGDWAAFERLGGSLVNYKALMVRAAVSTPPLFLETLYVPFFLVDTGDPGGTSTLFAVRNLTGSPVSVDVQYQTTTGTTLHSDTLNLTAFDTATVNLRDVPGLGADADGFARGYVELSTAGNPDMTPVLAGDFFQLDVDGNFATGDRLVRQIELCDDATIRFLELPLPGSGTRVTVFLANPRGVGAADPVSFTLQVFDEDGNPAPGVVSFKTVQHAVEIDVDAHTGLPFGHLRFDFDNAGGGAVFSEAVVDGRFSVGVLGQCDDLP